MLDLLIGFATMLICIVLQSAFIALGVQHCARVSLIRRHPPQPLHVMTLLAVIALLLLISAVVQIGIWSALFLLLGEFKNISAALGFSATNFASLGHGVDGMSGPLRTLGPMEAANGVLVLIVSIAVITATMINLFTNEEAAKD